MATGTANTRTTPPPPPPSGQSLANRRFIEQQLRRTSWHVKLVDLFGGLMVLAASLLVILLAIAVIDAWILDLGMWGRFLALVILGGCLLGYLFAYAGPLVLRQVNPQYAARMIEECEPGLKNSLINFLTFQSNRTAVQEVVYDAMEHRAATDLSHVPVESTVDRSKLIRVGYVLLGLMLVCGLYKVLSPKDPFQTFARVLSPFSQLSRPSRVRITKVTPGDAEVFRGDQVLVSAYVDEALEESDVQLLYTTEDGQVIDAAIPMSKADSNYVFECQLPVDEGGVQQSTLYRIVAGDAVSKDYRIKVLAAPTIVVERLEYEYPDYTGRANLVAERQGDVRALEGTRVTVHARANHVLKTANIELIPSTVTDGRHSPRAKTVAMLVSQADGGYTAQGSFTLMLQSDRRTPVFAGYRVHLLTTDGHRNQRPDEHRIEVIPDLNPEIEILRPERDFIEVAEDGAAAIELRGIDPDYGLTQITLRGKVGGDEVLNEVLLRDAKGKLGQSVVSFEFKPRDLGLEAGNQVEYWGVAKDNRTSPKDGTPEPNTTRTRPSYFFKVVAAKDSKDRSPEPSEEKSSSSDKKRRTDSGERGRVDDTPKDSPESEEPPKEGAGSKPSGDSGEPEEKSKGGGGSASSNPSDPSEESSDSEDKESGESGREAGSKSDKRGERDSSGDSTSSGESGSGSSKKSGDSSAGGSSSSGESGSGSKSTEDPHAGEVFEKVLEHLKEKEEESTGESGEKGDSSDSSKSDSGSSGSSQGDGARNSGGSAGERSSTGSKDGPSAEDKPGGAESTGDEPKSNPDKEAGSEGAGDKSDSPSGSSGQSNSGSGQTSGGKQSATGGQQSKTGDKSSAGGSADSQPAGSGGNKSKPQPNDMNGSSGGGGTQGGQKADAKTAGSQSPGGDAGQGNSGQKEQEGQSGGADSDSGSQESNSAQQQGGGGQSKAQQDGSQPQNGNGGQSSGNQSGKKQPSGGKDSSGGQAGGQKQQQQKSGGSGQQGGGSQSGQKKQQGGSQAQQSGSPATGGGKPKEGGSQSGGQGKQGKPGGGNKSEDKQGSPGGQAENKDQEKQKQSPGPGDKKQGGGAKSPGTSKKQSGSTGQNEGDRSGGGGAGGGQSSGQAGNDSAGGTKPSDEGAGTSDESGQADTSERAGDDQLAGRKTGQSGNETGAGSKTRQSETGNQPTDNAGSQMGKKDGSPFGGGGGTGDTADGPSKFDGDVAEADDPNLEYARKATDLALDYLRDQKANPDRELLDKLNLSPEELRSFVDRWESMKRSGAKRGTAEGRRLDESLKSLGLRPNRDQRRSGGAKKDVKAFGDSGSAASPPPKFLDGFNAFIKGTARAKEE